MTLDRSELPSAVTIRDAMSGQFDITHLEPIFASLAKMVNPSLPALAELNRISVAFAAQPKIRVLPKNWPNVYLGQPKFDTGWAAKSAALSIAAARNFDTQHWTNISKVLAAQTKIAPNPGIVLLVKAAAAALATSDATVTATPSAPPRRLTNPWAGVTPLTFVVTYGSVTEVLRTTAPDMPDPAVAFWALVATMILLGMYH